MAHSLSAKKRIRQSIKRRARNRARKELIKDQTKVYLTRPGGQRFRQGGAGTAKNGVASGQGGGEAHDSQEHRRPQAQPIDQTAQRTQGG